MYTFPTTPGVGAGPEEGKTQQHREVELLAPDHGQQAEDVRFEPLHRPFSNSQSTTRLLRDSNTRQSLRLRLG